MKFHIVAAKDQTQAVHLTADNPIEAIRKADELKEQGANGVTIIDPDGHLYTIAGLRLIVR
ncbi:hypothetical protein [Microvirga pudoricolor]|uniref:hypothetical protein n=1 Tax=Microvirga pudoricolor TaxID=2778729 RepID=UPI00195026B6|nr:hypothetical protein [Microvirga pudoricolor]MBM6593025.1 hypothetical protein [Microvirga pudoricolor]